MKMCNKCGERKPLGEFSKSAAAKDGLQPKCKGCERKYYAENREAAAEYRRKYYAENKGGYAERARKYRAENKEAVAERARKYRAENKEVISEYHRKYHAENMDAHAAYGRKYYLKLKELYGDNVGAATSAKRYLAKHGNLDNWNYTPRIKK